MPSALTLEILGLPKEIGVLTIPGTLKSLSSGAVVLELHHQEVNSLEKVKGCAAVIHLPEDQMRGPLELGGMISWVNPPEEVTAGWLLGLELDHPEGRQILEGLLPAVAKDIKGLWDCWDSLQAKPAAFHYPKFPTPLFFGAGSLLLAGGIALYFLRNDFWRMHGVFLMVSGGLIILARSLMGLSRR